MHYVGLLFLYALPGLLVIIPVNLRRTRPWPKASDLAKTLVPSWLAASAAAATFGYLFAQHWFGGPLAGLSVWTVLVGGMAVAALLAPGYQFMTRSFWEHGVEVVLDAGRWRESWSAVRFELLGFVHPPALVTRFRLARRARKAGGAAAARDQYARLLYIEERILGPEHPGTLASRNSPALACHGQASELGRTARLHPTHHTSITRPRDIL